MHRYVQDHSKIVINRCLIWSGVYSFPGTLICDGEEDMTESQFRQLFHLGTVPPMHGLSWPKSL